MTTTVEHIFLRLKDFSAPGANAPDLIYHDGGSGYRIDADIFPCPELLLYLLHEIYKLPLGSRGEKMHWTVPFVYKDVHYAIAFEKFGLRIYAERDADTRIKEVLGKLRKAQDAAEQYILNDVAKAQIAAGNISIANRFSLFDNQYHYFREQAGLAYSPLNPPEVPPQDFSLLSDVLNQMHRSKRDGGFNALAMIDAYFSRLEHILVLSLPFVEFNRDEENLAEFIGSLWSEKFRRVLGQSDKKIQRFYEQLVQVKEKFRNTFAHGGFEKNGQSFFFHLDKFGAVPASMSGVRDSVHFNYFPIDQDAFEKVCALFDEFDEYLSTTALPVAWKYTCSGLNIAFDQKSLSELLALVDDDAAFDSWLEYQHHLADMYANAEY